MIYEYSSNHKIEDFKNPDFDNKVYFGFASPPRKNRFSHKHEQAKYNSTTQILRNNFDLLSIEDKENTTLVMHMSPDLVTLDVATAAFAAMQSREVIHSEQWDYLAEYVNEIEQGVSRPPFLRSLYAFFYSTGRIAIKNFPKKNQISERNTFLIKRYWKTLEAVLDSGHIEGLESLCRFFDLIPQDIVISAQEDEIRNETNRYFYHDFPRAETLELELPLKHETSVTKYARVNLLAISNPRSSLLKYFTRNPMIYPDGVERFFHCMYVHDPENMDKVGEHIISVPPKEDFDLTGLTDFLEEIEDRARAKENRPERPKDKPRKGGYPYNDPWFDERENKKFSIVATPGDGSRLTRADILESLWYHAAPLKNIKPSFVTTSVFIPLWTPDRMKQMIRSTDSGWAKTTPDKRALKWFFPFVENIFSPKKSDPGDTTEPTLISYEFDRPFSLTLDPAFDKFEGIAIDVIQQKSLQKSREMISRSKLRLLFHQYEYGLGFFEIIINPEEGNCSIFNTQWLEQCISLTHFEILMKQLLDEWDVRFEKKFPGLNESVINRLEMPNKHFVSSTLNQFNYEGGPLTKGRSIGGALQMMVCDENPIYKNLPLNSEIITDQTVIDITSKRHYFCSSSSLLNFDDVANKTEHFLAHEASRIIFNMILAQRFILSKSRLDIVLAERKYNEKKKLSLLKWIARGMRPQRIVSLFKRNRQGVDLLNDMDDIVNISKLRTDIQHMTTSSWFHVISNKKSVQEVFNKMRHAMEIDHLYEEVQERCVELDEFIMKKESAKQSRLFGFFAYIMSPLGLIAGFAGGLEFNTWNMETRNPFPILDWFFPSLKTYEGGVWPVLGFYTVTFVFFIGIAWLLNKWWSLKE